MLNFFKKPKIKVATNATSKVKEYPANVKEIHNCFMNAGEKLLKEAKEIIAKAEIKDEEKVNRLKKIGFVNANQVKQADAAVERKRKAEQNAAIVEMYAVRYPQYKFITEEIVKQICEKYKLVMGGIQKYKGFVPEKNLLEIEAFKVKDEDCHESRINDYDRYLSLAQAASQDLDGFGALGGIGNMNRQMRNLEREAYYMQQQAALYFSRPKIEKEPPPSVNKKSENKTTTTYKREFLICAPQKDMKIESYEKVEGHKIVHIPDPVVLHPVKNGYLIVTAWGDEASDELIVNEIKN